jgi:hypothetical protein
MLTGLCADNIAAAAVVARISTQPKRSIAIEQDLAQIVVASPA